MRPDARKRSDNLSLRRGAGVVPSPGGDATTPAVVALTDTERDRLAREVLGGASPSPLMVRAVERIVSDRLVAAGVVSDAAAEEESPRPGGFCERHWSWLCQAGQGKCSGVAASKADTDEAGA